MADKTYINKCWFREKSFDNGGKVMNCGFNVEELATHADENGWVNMVIKERRAPNEKGYTHYAEKDNWKPSGQPFAQRDEDESQETDSDSDDLPF
tara:strand:+ start:43 stop:327 length:285 start_codon:yes stop_codon:yes gene_type:complete